MTKRQHDAATKEAWGVGRMASDERAYYRATRWGYDHPSDVPTGEDPLARRAALASRLEGGVISRGSPWLAVARYRSAKGYPMLGC